MDDLKYKILKSVHESFPTNPVSRKDFYADTKMIFESKRAIDELVQCGYLRETFGSDNLSITALGIMELERLGERRKQELIRQENIRKEQEAKEDHKRELEAENAARKKEKRSDRRFQLLLAIFQALLSFAAGVLLEHFTGLVTIILRLFD